MGNYIIHNGMLYSDDELYHYGVKGMKWGVRKDRQRYITLNGRNVPVGRAPKTMVDYSPTYAKKFKRIDEAHRNVSIEYKKNRDLMREYAKNPKSRREAGKRLEESNARLKKQVKDFLSTLDDDARKSIVKYDPEHMKRYVDGKIFDGTIDYDDFIYID